MVKKLLTIIILLFCILISGCVLVPSVNNLSPNKSGPPTTGNVSNYTGIFYEMSVPSIIPGNLTPGTPVTVIFTLNFPSYDGGMTFPNTDTLQIRTELDNSRWTRTLVVNGMKIPQPQTSGNILQLSGSNLSFPAHTEESMGVILQGTAPSVTTPTNKLLVMVQVFGSDVSERWDFYTDWIVNSNETPKILPITS